MSAAETEQRGHESNNYVGGLQNTQVVLNLDTEDIALPEVTNVRPYGSKLSGETEIKALQSLMASIEQEGQLEPVIVLPIVKKPDDTSGPNWNLVAGRRRLQAVKMLNMAGDGEPRRIKAIIGDEVKKGQGFKLFRRAAHENIQRAEISPIDFAYNIQATRKNMKWGAKDTKKVAEFFGVSEAQITQHEKLLELDEVLQQALADGRLSREGAYALLRVAPENRAHVYALALEKQAAEFGVGELAVARAREGELGDVLQSQVDALVTEAEDQPVVLAKKKSKKSGASKEGGVKTKHVQSAAREIEPDTVQPRTKKDIIEFFEGCQGPVYGYADGAVYQFVETFKKWIAGEVQDRTLEKYFDVMVEKADKGTPPPKPSIQPKKTIQDAPGRTRTLGGKKAAKAAAKPVDTVKSMTKTKGAKKAKKR